MPTFPGDKVDGEPVPFTDVDPKCNSGRRQHDIFPISPRRNNDLMPTFNIAKADGGPIPFADVDPTCSRRQPDMTPLPYFRCPGLERADVEPTSPRCCPAVCPACPLFLVDLLPSQSTSGRYIFAKVTRRRPVFPMLFRRESVLSSPFYLQLTLLCFPSDNSPDNTDTSIRFRQNSSQSSNVALRVSLF